MQSYKKVGLYRTDLFQNLQGIMEHYHDIVNYLNKKGVMVIFLFRRNTLRRIISVLANDYDRKTKQLNGTHKAHVHSREEVPLTFIPMQSSQIYYPKQYVSLFLEFLVWVNYVVIFMTESIPNSVFACPE